MNDVVFWQWAIFGCLVAVLLALDLLVFHRDDRAPSLRGSACWTLFWCGLALTFNGLLWWWRSQQAGPAEGREAALSFFIGYLVEWSLSMDNVFVFAVIFRFFQVPAQYQYRVLFWGILGAIGLRLLFILAGVQLINHFSWTVPLLGVLLVYTAVKLAIHTETEVQPENNLVLRVARRWLRVSHGGHHEHGHAFFVRQAGHLCITPLFLVLLVIETTDIVFAVDSVPAILGITKDPFVVFTSNIFAILGLRALYFLLAGAIEAFRYLHYGLATVLAFVGVSMIGDHFLVSEPGGHLVPTWAKLIVIATALGVAIAASLASNRAARSGNTSAKP
ncbi:MAG: TerC/Alx family metal homeostasis membrane protein [Thermoguttaceae bacterium]